MAGELERVRKALGELSKALASPGDEPSPRQVHNLRTASRRVEAVAAVLEAADRRRSRHLLQSLDPVRKSAGHVRDIDVLAVHACRLRRYGNAHSLARLLEYLQNSRRQRAAELHHALHRRRKALREELKAYSRFVRSTLRSRADRGQSQENIHEAAMRVIRELGGAWPLDAGNLHAFRLKVKRLRYILQLDAEAGADLIEALGEAQRRIGDWHDWQALEEIARPALIQDEDRPLVERIEATTRRRYQRALAAAHALHGKYLAMPMAAGV